jgi:flagellar motor protein MotB
MKRLARHKANVEEEESVFVTMTDMVISFLLIIMILLAFFATQLNDDKTVPLSAYERVRQERDDLRVAVLDLRELVMALEDELARVGSELGEVTVERDDLRVAALDLRELVMALEDELARVGSELGEVTVERDELIIELERLREENQSLLVELNKLDFENRQLRLREGQLTAEIHRLRDAIEKLQVVNQEMRASILVLEQEVNRFKLELKTVSFKRDRLVVELRELREEYEMLLIQVLDLRAENLQLRSSVESLTDENERLQEIIATLRVANPLEAYLSQAIIQRREILIELRSRLSVEFPDLKVMISPEQDALRFQGEGLFRSGSSQLRPRQRAIVETMGKLLDEILVCFALGRRAERGAKCNSGDALIEAVQIEGHTDSDGTDLSNLRLSTDRANATLIVMLGSEQRILDHQNLRGQPVMSVSGYGEMRPIDSNDTAEGKAANRRIDLRVIMYAPSTVEEVQEVGRRLDELRIQGGLE